MATKKGAAPRPAAPRAAVEAPADETLTEMLLRLVEDERPERRSAAAVLFAELRPSEERVLEALRKAVRRMDDAQLRRISAEALGAIAPKSLITDLQPLLKDPDRGVRKTVEVVLASGKTVKAEDIARMMDEGDDKERMAAIAVLGAMATAEARRYLLARLKKASGRTQSAIIDALRPGLVALEGKEAEGAVEDIVAILDAESLASDPDYSIAVVQLIGNVPSDATEPALIKIAGSKAPEDVRAAAIEGLQKAAKGRANPKIFKTVLDWAEDANEPAAIHTAAVLVLSNLDVPLPLEPRVRALVTAESGTVRRWAIKALGTLDTSPAGEGLARVVEQGDPNDRELALDAALQTNAGLEALAKLFGRLKDEERARLVAKGMRTKAETMTPTTRRALEKAVIEAGPDIGRIVLEVLKHAGGEDAGRVQENLVDKAIKLKKKGQYSDAASMLKSLTGGRSSDAEATYQLLVCELKQSKRTLTRGPNNDPCLQTAHALLRNRDFPLLDRLRKEDALEGEDLYYLGFSLAERDDPSEQGLGGDILAYLAESQSDTKLGRMAHNKLVTMGWE